MEEFEQHYEDFLKKGKKTLRNRLSIYPHQKWVTTKKDLAKAVAISKLTENDLVSDETIIELYVNNFTKRQLFILNDLHYSLYSNKTKVRLAQQLIDKIRKPAWNYNDWKRIYGSESSENVSTISIEQLGVGVEFKFPVNWFKPPFTEFVLVSKEELSDGEWKIVFDPLVKKGVSDIEATIKSDTQFELLNTGSYGYESDDDDDYLPDSLRDDEIIEEVVEVPKPTFTPSGSQEMLLKILNKAFNDRGWNETGLQPTTFQWIMDKAKFDGIARRRPQFRELLASLRDANMITIEKFEGWKEGDAIYSPIEMIEEKEDERVGRIKHTDKFEEFVAFNPSIFNAETFGDYTPEDLVMSSAIEGFQPMKYSVVSNAESDDYDKTYGKKQGAIRRRLKNKIMGQAIVGTKKGQWSARKSQELKRQYEEACEKKGLNAYKGKKTKKQKDLSKWSKQDWTTKSGKPSSKTGERYLPAKAIDSLTDKEYKKTSDKKRKDTKKGKQFSDQPKKIADKVAKYRAETFESKGGYRRKNKYIYHECFECGYKTEPIPLVRAQSRICPKCKKGDGFDVATMIAYEDFEKTMALRKKEMLENFFSKHPDMSEEDKTRYKKKYGAESSKPHSVTISRSSNSEKKLMAVFEDSEGKKIKTTHFGQRGADDYTKHDKDIRDERKKLYLERHGGGTTTSTKENWKDPTTAGALSRWILWNKPSLKGSFDDYKSRFGLKGSINVSKSAEERKCKSCEKPATNVVQEGSFCYECLPINLGAETFEATEWVGFCPECNKWRTKDMSLLFKNLSKNRSDEDYIIDLSFNGWSVPKKLLNKRLCGKSKGYGDIQRRTDSWSGYGQRTHNNSVCGTPLKKVKSKYKAEFEAKFPTFQFAGAVLLVSLLPLFLDNRRDKV